MGTLTIMTKIDVILIRLIIANSQLFLKMDSVDSSSQQELLT